MRWVLNDNYNDIIFFSVICKFGLRCKYIGNNEIFLVFKYFSIELKKIF